MTVQAGPTEKRYAANGVSLAYTIPFLLIASGDLDVYLNGTLITTGFTITGVGNPTSTITFNSAPTGDLYLLLNVPFERLVDYQENGDFLAKTVNRDFDRIWQALKQLFLSTTRAPLLGVNDIDGHGFYRAKGNGLIGLASANGVLDAAPNWQDVLQYVASILATGQGPVNNAANLVYVYPDLVARAIQTLATKNDPLLGAAGIAFRNRTIYQKLMESLTVEDFGAVGGGIADDKPAFLAMFSATGGYIRLLEKSYNVNGLTLTGSLVVIKSKAKPAYNATYTQLVGGSILVGNFNIRAGQVDVQGVGIDAGSARGISVADGFVINAPVGGAGIKVVCRDNIVLGTNETSDSHAILIQGFNDHDVQGNDTALHQFGVVVKGRNGFIKNTTGYRIRTAVVYPKSDIPAVGGDVADATANTLTVDGVNSRANPANVTCNAVYVHASTSNLSNVSVSHVKSTYGNAGLRIAGGSDTSLVTSGVTFDDIQSERAVCGVDLFGYNYDTVGTKVIATNPTSGRAVQTSGNSYNYNIIGIELLISDPSIVSTDAAQFNGTGLWDDFTARNPYRVMSISSLIASVSSGNISGDVKLALEGNLTMASSWGSSGGHVPRLMIGPKNCIHLTGWAAPAVATGDQIAFLPFPLSDEKFFSCVARKTDGTYITVTVYVAGTIITLMSTTRSTLTYVDLSGVTFYLR